jgi:hypothetical protein
MESTPISSHIDAVTVFSEGAQIRRVGEIAAGDAGYPTAIRFSGLPLALEDASVRVAVEPAEAPRPSGDDTGDNTGDNIDADAGPALPVAADFRIALDIPDKADVADGDLDDALRDARIKVRKLDDERGQIEREIARIRGLSLVARPDGEDGEPPPPSPTDARLALLSFRTERERGLRDQLAAATELREQAARELARIEDRRRRASSVRKVEAHELRKTVIVTLRGGEAARARLVVSYRVPGARWAPAYTARIDRNGTSAQLAMRAVVAQDTGEDWRGVKLTLSTADAQGWTELPELASRRIGRRQQAAPKTGWRPPPTGVQELYRDYDRAFGGPGGRADSERHRRETEPDPMLQEMLEMQRDTAEYDVPSLDDDAINTSFMAPDLAVDFAADLEDEPSIPRQAPRAKSKAKKRDRGERARRMAPPPPAAPRMSASMAPPPAPPMASYGASAVGGAAPGGYPMPQAAAAPLRSGPPHSGEIAGHGMFGTTTANGVALAYQRREQAQAQLSLGVLAQDELLAYGDLRMPAPGARARGSLQLVQRREVYLQLIAEQRVELSFDILDAVASAHRRAHAVTQKRLPRRHRVARADRYDYAYAAETPVDVVSDGNFHNLSLQRRSATVRMRHVVVPRESTDVFRVAALENPLDAPLLAGPVDVYLGKDFLLTGEVAFTPPSGSVQLGLGVEQRIKVSRNTFYSEESAGLIRGALLLNHAIEIEIANHAADTVECEVRERLPSLTEDEDDIELTVGKVEPAWSEYAPKEADSPEAGLRGGHVWKVWIGRGERKTLRAAYTVRISAKNELVGGNRREA